MNLDKLKEADIKVDSCFLCKDTVEKFNNNTSIHLGKITNILLLGEAPANNGWRKSGKAWYDMNGKKLPSGKVMDKLLFKYNFVVEDITFIEAIKCFPVSRKNIKRCSLNCKAILLDQILAINPKLIITLGDAPTRILLNEDYKNFSEIVGNVYKVLINDNYVDVLPIYHPSPISPKSYCGNVDIIDKIAPYLC